MAQPISINIRVGWEEMQEIMAALGAGQFPNLGRAVEQATALVQRNWLAAASGAEVSYRGRSFAINRRSGAYARSISDGMEYPLGSDPLAGRVSATAEHADAIEKGTPPHDMKPTLLSGPRARVSREGVRYVIIPFRHNVPGASATGKPMPKEVYRAAKTLAMSQVTGKRPDVNARGEPVERATYKWGGQASVHPFGWRSRIAPQGHEYTHKVSIYEGMVRMGPKGHSTYMTFRVASENSDPNSWWSPGVEPKPVSEAVAEMSSAQVDAIIRGGFEADLAALGSAS